jgi:hypothetical protein
MKRDQSEKKQRKSVHANAKGSLTGREEGRKGKSIFTTAKRASKPGRDRIITRSVSRRNLNMDILAGLGDVCPGCSKDEA